MLTFSSHSIDGATAERRKDAVEMGSPEAWLQIWHARFPNFHVPNEDD